MKRILILLLLFLAVTGYSQTVQKFTYDAGFLYGIYFADVDSAETLYSEYFDASVYDGQNQVYIWSIVNGADDDSLSVCQIEGRMPAISVSGTTSPLAGILIDTIATNKTTGIQSILGTAYSQTISRGILVDTAFIIGNVPPVRTFPEWRIKVTGAGLADNYNNKVWIWIYIKKNDENVIPRSFR